MGLPARFSFRARFGVLAVACLAAGLLALAASGALAANKPPPDLWATINICNTKNHPNALGIRARMPGNGTKQRMYMRFFAQYRSGKHWHDTAQSPWRFAGSAVYKWAETGWTFQFKKPGRGDQIVLRGVVNFRWKQDGKVVRQARAVTSAHHPTTEADPPGYSAGICRIKG